MDDETRAAIQQLTQRLDQAEKSLATHSTMLVKQVVLIQKLMGEMTISLSTELKSNERLNTLEKSLPVLEKRFSNMEDMFTPKLPGEITIADAIQQLVNTVSKMAAEMVLYRRNMREAPSPSDTVDENPLVSPILQ